MEFVPRYEKLVTQCSWLWNATFVKKRDIAPGRYSHVVLAGEVITRALTTARQMFSGPEAGLNISAVLLGSKMEGDGGCSEDVTAEPGYLCTTGSTVACKRSCILQQALHGYTQNIGILKKTLLQSTEILFYELLM